MTAVDTSTVYRDATYSARTQERLIRLLSKLTLEAGWNEGERGEEVRALTDVVERWNANDATETIFDAATSVSPLLSTDPTFADADIVVYNAACPSCERALEWAIRTPPIPRTYFTWLNDDGQTVTECPGCDASLPEGDLTKRAMSA